VTRRRTFLLLTTVFFIAAAFTVWANKPYKVVGKSMEPALVDGDWLVLRNGEPKLGDHVIFREPDSGKIAVKSVAGLPGQRVQLIDNDLYLNGKIHRRPIYSAADLVPILDSANTTSPAPAVPAFPLQEAGFNFEEAHWTLEQSGLAVLQRQPLDSYILREGFHDGEVFASDLGVEVAYELLSPEAELHLVLHKGLSAFTLILADGGSRLRLVRSDQPNNKPVVVLEQEINPARPTGSAFLTLADRAITFAIDREPQIEGRTYQLTVQPPLSDGPVDLPTFELAGIGGVGPLRLGRVRLGRDISYRSTGTIGVSEAFQLSEEQYFLIGDNPSQSRDSRNYGAVPQDRILGVVSYRAWPRGWTDRGWVRD
jgi:signal peptidase I